MFTKKELKYLNNHIASALEDIEERREDIRKRDGLSDYYKELYLVLYGKNYLKNKTERKRIERDHKFVNAIKDKIDAQLNSLN